MYIIQVGIKVEKYECIARTLKNEQPILRTRKIITEKRKNVQEYET